jgi:hypothetical protein
MGQGRRIKEMALGRLHIEQRALRVDITRSNQHNTFCLYDIACSVMVSARYAFLISTLCISYVLQASISPESQRLIIFLFVGVVISRYNYNILLPLFHL